MNETKSFDNKKYIEETDKYALRGHFDPESKSWKSQKLTGDKNSKIMKSNNKINRNAKSTT